jgi:hypothetical protein
VCQLVKSFFIERNLFAVRKSAKRRVLAENRKYCVVKCGANLLMLEPSRHERNGYSSVVSWHFLMPSLATFKTGAGHGFSNEIGEISR